MKITKRECEALARRADAAAAAGRPFFWDDGLKGFGLRLNAPGRLAYVLKYRVRGDPRQRLLTLGEWPATAPDAARAEAGRIKAAAALGRDLVAERRADIARAAEERRARARLAVPLTDLLDLWRAATEAAMAAKDARGGSVLYERELLRLERTILRPGLGDATAGGLDPARFQALLHLQTSISTARNLRNLVVRFCRFANAEMTRRGLPVRWPGKFEVAGRPPSRSHRYTLAEAARLWTAAGTLGRRGALVRLMLLTGCRRIEAQKAAWSHLHLDDPRLGPFWLQPGELTKNRKEHRVPLSPPAVALLRWLPPRATADGRSPLIFAGRGGRLVGDWTAVRRALLEAAGVDAGTLHDFRRTIVSTLGDHGFDPQVADTLLNHSAAATMGGVMGVYQRSELWTKRRAAAALWADLLMEAAGAAQGRPVDRETWGFDAPFADVRIVRPERAGPRSAPRSGRSGRQAARGGVRPSSTGRISAATHADRSSGR